MRTNLRMFRNNKGFQRKFIAEKMNISGKHLNDIENGKVNLTEKNAKKLSTLYNISIDEVKSMYQEGRSKYE